MGGCLCSALSSANRWALWGKPEPSAALLPISSFDQTKPPDLQDLYLGSLEAIGIDMALHDIRFVEDDWESPTLGPGALGGKCGVMAWKSASSPISNRSAGMIATRVW